jgi:predicted hotdog family 3-hydroxylacyl-ACP dehydratase
LRNNGSLPVSALIEYGAQAMAVHGALIAKDLTEQIQEGYCTVNCHCLGAIFYQS